MDEINAPLRFAIVGCGAIASTHAQVIGSLFETSLVACCDIVPERAVKFARAWDLPSSCAYAALSEMLARPDIDAVSICTPSGLHASLAKDALASGRHVLMEKPCDVTPAVCDDLIAFCANVDLAAGVISQHRFDPASIRAKALVDSGALGRILLVEAQIKWYRTQDYYDSGDWRGTWELDGGGALMNQGVHTVDLMRWLAGPLKSVYATARTSAHERIEVEDVVCATLEFTSGAIGNIVATTAAYPGFPATLSVHGERGSVVLSGDEIGTIALMGHRHCDAPEPAEIVGIEPTDSSALPSQHALSVAQGGTRSVVAASGTQDWNWGDAHRAQFAEFVAAVREQRQPSVSVDEGREAVAIIDAVYRSARTGLPVNP